MAPGEPSGEQAGSGQELPAGQGVKLEPHENVSSLP